MVVFSMKIPSLLFIWSFYPTLFIHLTLCIHCIILYLKLCVVCQAYLYLYMKIVLNEICKSSAMMWIQSSVTTCLTKPQICSSKTASKGRFEKKTSSFSKTFYISEQLNFKHIPNKATEHLWLKPNGFCNNFIYISVNKEKMSYNVLMLVDK